MTQRDFAQHLPNQQLTQQVHPKAKLQLRQKSQPAATTEGPMTEEVVSGFETPCHVAAVRGHHAAVLQLKEHL